jgi:hypothetical protein
LLIGVAMGKLPSAHELLGVSMVVGALLIHTALSRSVALRAGSAPIRNTTVIQTNRSACAAPS